MIRLLLLCGLQETGHLNTCSLLFQQVICYVSSSMLRETCTFCFTLISSSCCSCASLFVPELFHQGSCYFGLCLHHLHVSCTIVNLTDLKIRLFNVYVITWIYIMENMIWSWLRSGIVKIAIPILGNLEDSQDLLFVKVSSNCTFLEHEEQK
jgi:hypothetical protein